MGIRPQLHEDEMFKVQPIESDSLHPVPVSNFLNAQCELIYYLSFEIGWITDVDT